MNRTRCRCTDARFVARHATLESQAGRLLTSICRVFVHRYLQREQVTLRRALSRSRNTAFADGTMRDIPGIEPLRFGPPCLQANNLLASVPERSDQAHDHSVLQLLVASRATHTTVHSDFYACDGYLQLMEGEKLWLFAPNNQQETILRLFGKNVNVNKFTAADKQAMVDHHVQAVVQKAGDLLSVPAGWFHAVKNLTDIVAFGGSYLRPWKLEYHLLYLCQQPKVVIDSTINWRGIFDQISAEKQTWLSTADKKRILERYAALERHFGTERPWKSLAQIDRPPAETTPTSKKRKRIAAA